MRCKNCGWDNPDHNVQCEKCRAPLDKSDREPVQLNNRDSISAPNVTVSRDKLNATVRENKLPVQEGEENGQQAANASFCSACGYRLRAGDASCPVCGKAINAKAGNEKQQPPNVNTPESTEAPARNMAETVNPWTKNGATDQNVPVCTLTPVVEDQPTQQTASALQYAGSEIVLSRQNTDPENVTVTSQEQAALVYENGNWFIEDRSSMKTTFVHAGERKQLKAGDMILMGNKRFIFNKS